MKRAAARRPAPQAANAARDALVRASGLLLGHFVAEARAVLEAGAGEAGAAALAAIADGKPAMEVRAILLREMARA